MKGISYIITTYNRYNLLVKSVESIFLEKFTKCELIIVDDCSENTVRLEKKYTDMFESELFIVRNEKNEGVIKARNKGIFKAKYDYLIFLDDDDVSYSNRSKILFDAIENSNYAFVSGKCILKSETGKLIVPEISYSAINPFSILCNPPHINGIIWRRKILTEIGGFDEEPCDLGEHVTIVRLLLKGFSAFQINDIVSEFRYLDMGITRELHRQNKLKESLVKFYEKIYKYAYCTKYFETYGQILKLLPEQTIYKLEDYLKFVEYFLKKSIR